MKLFLLMFFVFITSCTNMFLQPTRIKYFSPEKFNIIYTEHSIKSFDETELSYWYFPAQKISPDKIAKTRLIKTRALLVQFHGNSQNISSHFSSIMWPLGQGIDVVTFDYRSFGKSGGEKEIDGVYSDALFMLGWASKQALKKDIPLIIYGQSLGGSLVLKAIQELRPKNLKLAIIEGSFYSYKQIAREKLSEHWLTWLAQPLAYVLVSNKYTPGGDALAKISPTSVLLIYSTKDPVIPITHGYQIFDKLKEPKEMWTHNNKGHINAVYVEKGKYKYKIIEKINSIL